MNIRLKDYLKDNKITERELASRLGTSVQYVCGICNGRLVVSHKRLVRIAEVLGCRWTDIVTREYVDGLRKSLGLKKIVV